MLAMLFKIILDIEADFNGLDVFHDGKDIDLGDSEDRFITAYNLYYPKSDMMFSIIILQYFSFTSLTTVGFGDYNPKSNIERLFIAFSLLFGVAIFSYIIGKFFEILASY